jgi:serine/threonine protein kinase/WD40 repeat protein
MDRPPLKRVEEVFHQAVALAPSERPTFLEEACAGDTALRAAVEDLLRHDDDEEEGTDHFLASPVAPEAEELRLTRLDGRRRSTSGAGFPLPRIPGYEVLEERGRGGMGVVYQARQVGLNRIVALKMLLPDRASAPELLGRFRAEAEALARLHHPNVVPVYDVGACEGRPYFTMEYVAGPNLAEVLDGRPQDPAAAARLLEVLARTIHAVHQAGLIHRDLKPANILLAAGSVDGPPVAAEPTGRPAGATPLATEWVPKITDFGLVKDQTAERKLTRSGMAMGTPCYMAPEQARGRAGTVGPAADLYALGAILYEMLTGRPPFDAESQAETIVQLLHEEPLSPARLRPRLPHDLVTICLKCLEKSPRQRYASAWELAEDLRRFLADEPIRARPVGVVERSYRWCRRRPLVAGLTALSGLLAVAFVVTGLLYTVELRKDLVTTEAKAETEQKEIVQLHVSQGVMALEEEDTFTAVVHFTEALRLEEDGSRVRNHRVRIATARRQTPTLRAQWTLNNPVFPEPSLAVALSPDRHLLAVAAGTGTVQVSDLVTGQSRAPVPGRGEAVRHLAFDSDGHLLLTEYAKGRLRSWDLSNPEPVPLQEFSVGEATFAALSNNGRWLFTLDAGHRGELREVATGKTTAAPLELRHDVRLGAVSPDGRRLALVSVDNVLTVWDVPAARPLGKPVALARDLDQVVLSPDAGRVVTAGTTRTAEVLQVQPGELRAAWSRLDGPAMPVQFSPDGRLLLLGDRTGRARVWDAVTGQAVTAPLQHGGRLAWAGFHDDGKQVVTVSTGGTVCLWELPHAPGARGAVLDGAPAATEGAAVDRGQSPVQLGKDGAMVTGGRATAGTLRPPGPMDRRVEHAVFSPDGRWVVVCSDASTVQVWDSATPTARPPSLLRHGGDVLYGAFSPDGARLLTASDDRTVRVWEAATGELLAPPLRHSRAIERVFFRDNGERACVVQEGGVVCTWDLTPDERLIDDPRAAGT